ncbi:MAG TPA: Ig-like domain-containing protein, partial [Gemmatimonadaceae bacterium]|nr:Ig-like domain-containing protein [Gemmatimonadaceae bacterium]
MRRGPVRAFAAIVAAGWLTACAGLSDFTGPTPITERVAGVEVTPRELSLSPGGSATLQVTVRDESGAVARDRVVVWTTSDPAVATVSDAGVVAAIAVGEAQIAVSSGGRSAVTQVRVVPRPVARVDVSPGAPELLAGDVVQLAATPRDEAGAALPDRVVTWQSSDL